MTTQPVGRDAIQADARADATSPAGHAGLALAAVCLGFFMVLVDGSALNVALPSIQHDIHGTIAALQWVVNIYTIPLASVLLTAGSLGDRWGSRRLFVASLSVFTFASLLCAISPNLGFLIAARALQGVAAGGMLPTTLAIIGYTYADPIERVRAITVWGTVGALALLAGPLVGGAMTNAFGWRSIFLINLPVGVVTTYLAVRYVRERTTLLDRKFDPLGQVTAIAALGALVAGLIEGGSLGWTSPVTLGLLALGVLAAAAFIVTERRVEHPMLPLDVFRRSAFTAAVMNGFAFQFGGYGIQFVLAVYLQERWHVSPLATGLLFLPFSAFWVLGTIVLARRLVHMGPRWLLRTGGLVSLVGSLALLGVTDGSSWPWLIAGTLLVGLGCGIFAPSLNAAVLLAIEPRFAGLGSGILNAARQIGMAVGVALLGAFLVIRTANLGLRLDALLVALCFVAIIVLSVRYVPVKEGAS
ncbi:MAG TPA: MFS transporter [Candidatus Dormibacteraeota bacterium]|nr:MFS transporter [Candidatus Dormibacteraeota bacterium]